MNETKTKNDSNGVVKFKVFTTLNEVKRYTVNVTLQGILPSGDIVSVYRNGVVPMDTYSELLAFVRLHEMKAELLDAIAKRNELLNERTV